MTLAPGESSAGPQTEALRTLLVDALKQRPERNVAVAFSGGPDSTALLGVLAGMPEARARNLRALHVDHGLHRQSAQWAADCRKLCARLGVPLEVLRAQVERNSGLGLEAAARSARYALLADALGQGELLATGHHRQDQAETFLLRALRASGPDGLAAMRPTRPLGNGTLWRPLLNVGVEHLRQCLAELGLPAITDPSNSGSANDRAWLRQHLLPVLMRRWAHVDRSLARSADLCAEASALLSDEDANTLLQLTATAPDRLDRSGLLALPASRRARVLRQWLTRLGLPPLPGNGIARIEADLLDAAPDSAACFDWAGAWVRRWRDALHAGWAPADIAPVASASWDGRTPLPMADGRLLRLQPCAEFAPTSPQAGDGAGPGFVPPVVVRARCGGERITLPGRRHSHSLKHLLQQSDIPPWQRQALPLLFASDGTLLACGDRIVSARLHDWLARHGLRLSLGTVEPDGNQR